MYYKNLAKMLCMLKAAAAIKSMASLIIIIAIESVVIIIRFAVIECLWLTLQLQISNLQ